MTLLQIYIRAGFLIVLSFVFILTSTSLYSYTIFDQRTKQLAAKASAGDKRAQYKLGLAYLRGTTVKYNRYTARKWLTLSAAQNYYKASYTLGEMHYTSKYRMRNYRTSFRWFMKAAKFNHGHSQYYIALHYFMGKGVARKKFTALIWAARAEKNGVAEAKDLLSAIHVEIVRVSKQAKLAAARKRKAKAIAQARVKARALARKKVIARAARKTRARALAQKRALAKAKVKAKQDQRAKVTARLRVLTQAKVEAQAKALATIKVRNKEVVPNSKAVNVKVKKRAIVRANEQQEISKPELDLMNILVVRKLIYGAKWLQNGEPSDYAPSISSECVQIGNSIKCESKRIRNKFDDYTVHFQIMSTITDFRAKGEFTILYRKNYLLVLSDNPINNSKMPALGLSTKVGQLHCRISSKTQILCVKPDSSKLVMTTGLSSIGGSVTATGH